MKAFRAGVTAFFLVIVSGLSIAGAQDLKIPPAPDRWATDTAGFLSPEALQALDTKLESFEKQTGHQVLVYVGKTTGGYPIEEFADKAFQAWAVGRKGLDDGVALFIMAEDRAIRIEIGYGLESVIPDISAGRIVNDILIPKLRAGDADGAVSDAITAVLGAISGEPVQVEGARKEGRSAGKGLLIIAVIIFAIIFMTSPSLAFWLLINIFGGRGSGLRGSGSSGGGFRRSTSSGSFGGWSRGSSGGGFRSSGGGFRGGGGRSGGGGASGRW